jgi:hypothetical protein
MIWPLMSEEEMHEFGLQLIFPYIQKEGFEIKEINKEIHQNPQIICLKDDTLAFIFARTTCYPNHGRLDENMVIQCIQWSAHHAAEPYFAGIGICLCAYPDKTPVKSQEEWGLPVRYGGFYVAYEGVKKMSIGMSF